MRRPQPCLHAPNTVLCVVLSVKRSTRSALRHSAYGSSSASGDRPQVTTHFDVQYVLTALGRCVMNIAIGNRREAGNPILPKTA